MYEVNDYVVYGNIGVCKVLEIGTLDMDGIDKQKMYYTLEPLKSTGSTIYTPVENKKVILRDVISKDEAMELLDDLGNVEVLNVTDNKFSEEKYKKAMKKYDFKEFLRVIKTLYIKERERNLDGKTITSTDKKYLDAAKECLYGELSITLEMPLNKVEAFLQEKVQADMQML
jgi:CarD family transcriptional regulator